MSRLKNALKYLVSPITVPIKDGPLKGKRWIPASGIRYIRGKYVTRDTQVFIQNVHQGDVVFDIGAHVGYFTVLSSTLCGSDGKVVAFEPLPLNAHYLSRHVKVNQCTNVTILRECVSDRAGTASFDNSKGTGTGHLSEKGSLQVATTTLDTLVGEGKVPAPTFIKMNVEGAEEKILHGGKEVISKHKPFFLITLHSNDLLVRCRSFLEEQGYQVTMTGKDALTASATSS